MAATANALTIVSMAALGLGVDVRSVVKAGPRVTLAVVASLAALTAVSLGLIRPARHRLTAARHWPRHSALDPNRLREEHPMSSLAERMARLIVHGEHPYNAEPPLSRLRASYRTPRG